MDLDLFSALEEEKNKESEIVSNILPNAKEDIGKLEELLLRCTKGDLEKIEELAPSIETYNLS